MRPRGRRHWTERVTVASITRGTGPNAGSETITPTNRTNLPATVQSLDREAQLRHALNTDQEHAWVRTTVDAKPITPLTTGFIWNNLALRVVSVNETPGVDVECICLILGPAPTEGGAGDGK